MYRFKQYQNGSIQGISLLINTFVSEGREARRDNYIITATDIQGPWSMSHMIEHADGIDSSIFFDEDGRICYTRNFIYPNPLYEGHHGIYLQELDRNTLRFTSTRKIIWDGSKNRSKWIEAPHIYKRNGYYYLLTAEGGHLSLMHPISVMGHADIVETQNGEWWMVLLGVRPYQNNCFNTGRETFLVPAFRDEDGWLRK